LVDCANGIGGQCLHNLIKFIDPRLKFAILNNDTSNSEKLNADCGADFVKINQKEPFDLQVGARACSLDGDADRIVFYYKDSTGFKLLDGDKIATLAASYILHLLRTSNARKDNGSQLTIGVIQTAYANGSSTKYIRETLVRPPNLANSSSVYADWRQAFTPRGTKV
jgi:phosphoacetylglucosamine mutase